ncbi:MAG TPA: hypothetical protein VN709_11825 [Terriglobales bacterium]|nr:hypothetical protein [Terriglobales bacterium]
MRTTVTLDPDTERLLRDAMHRTRKSFKDTLNGAIREALAPAARSAKLPRFVVRPYRLKLRAGIDPTQLNKLVDELEVDGYLEKARRHKRKRGTRA